MAEELDLHEEAAPVSSATATRAYRSPLDSLMHVRWADGLDVSVTDLRAAWELWLDIVRDRG